MLKIYYMLMYRHNHTSSKSCYFYTQSHPKEDFNKFGESMAFNIMRETAIQ